MNSFLSSFTEECIGILFIFDTVIFSQCVFRFLKKSFLPDMHFFRYLKWAPKLALQGNAPIFTLLTRPWSRGKMLVFEPLGSVFEAVKMCSCHKLRGFNAVISRGVQRMTLNASYGKVLTSVSDLSSNLLI